jgi:xylan 1,4-beta-xylosidase
MSKRMGLIRLYALPAPDVRHARAFTEYVSGPRASVTLALGAAGLKHGAIAGLALSRTRDAWLGVESGPGGFTLTQFDGQTGEASRIPLRRPRAWLRATCDFVDNTARFSYSTDGKRYAGIGEPHRLGDDQAALQGVRCSLFSYGTQAGAEGGHADFDSFVVTWP